MSRAAADEEPPRLPKNWSRHLDEHGAVYYWHCFTGKIQHHPDVPYVMCGAFGCILADQHKGECVMADQGRESRRGRVAPSPAIADMLLPPPSKPKAAQGKKAAAAAPAAAAVPAAAEEPSSQLLSEETPEVASTAATSAAPMRRAAIGWRVAVLWSGDGPDSWYSGVVKDYSEASGQHFIK